MAQPERDRRAGAPFTYQSHREAVSGPLVAAILFAGSFALRAPFASKVLVNWDAVQFALGTLRFDLARHQPHPPGYLAYIAWGGLLTHLTGSVNFAFVLISMLGGSAAVAMFYLVARRAFGQRAALIGACLFGVSPLLWYYSTVALTYALESFLVLVIVWYCQPLLDPATVPAVRRALLSGLALGLVGSLRPTTSVLLIPLWLVCVLPHGRRAILQGAGGFLAGWMLWFAPLTVLAGGPLNYFKVSLELAASAGSGSSILTAGWSAGLLNLAEVTATILVSINVSGLALLPFLLRRANWPAALTPAVRRLGLAWLTPPLLVYVAGHFGQAGYVLLVLPAFFMLIGACLDHLSPSLSLRFAMPQWAAASRIVLGLAAISVAIFLAAPPIAAQAVGPVALPFNLPENDRFWEQVVDYVHRYPADETVILTGSTVAGSFRHATYYLPEYQTYAIGDDRHGQLGELFQAYGQRTNYDLAGLEHSASDLQLGPGVRRLIVLDTDLAMSIAPTRFVVPIPITEHRSIYVVPTGSITGMSFHNDRVFLRGNLTAEDVRETQMMKATVAPRPPVR